ncbi:MAG: glycosyltransferase family 4 protein [Anaerolineales bacterium]|nr:glycosyltransferase family 4 protein [Anaerolineales bacterium]MCB0018774.1 glycosyltransferase family 4 protein [Anaerolineales bacterium]MCB8960746.1 glycosyltransferase family 4 protein [Ardenticatenales bacterium]
MRIAYIGPFGFHPNKTMRARAFRIARELVVRGHEVKMFMPPWHTPDESNKEWVEEGVTIRYVPLGGGVLGISRRLAREALGFEPEIVHCFKPKGYSGLAAFLLWQTQREKLRLIMDTDDWEGAGGWNDRAPYTAMQKRFFAWQEIWGMRHCHALTVASRALQGLAWGHGVKQGRVVYLPNGSGIDWVSDRAVGRQEYGLGDRPVLLLYSRLFEFDTARLVAVLQKVVAEIPDLTILFIGAGLFSDEAANYRQQLSDAGLLERVVDTGWLDEEYVPNAIAAADVGLYLMEDNLLNRTKCPVKLADMVKCGLPLVGERVGEVSEYIRHEETGFFYETGNIDGVSQGIIRLLQQPELRQKFSETAIVHYNRNFNWAHAGALAEDVYLRPAH